MRLGESPPTAMAQVQSEVVLRNVSRARSRHSRNKCSFVVARWQQDASNLQACLAPVPRLGVLLLEETHQGALRVACRGERNRTPSAGGLLFAPLRFFVDKCLASHRLKAFNNLTPAARGEWMLAATQGARRQRASCRRAQSMA